MKPFEIDVTSSYGAPMGRPSDEVSGAVNLEKVPFVDGDYDPGGAYWGGGSKDGDLFCAWNDEGSKFFRAKSLKAAKAMLAGCTILESANDPEMALDGFLTGYVKAALWSSNDDQDEPLDSNYGPDDLSDDTLDEMREDCRNFLLSNAADVATMHDPARAGFCFWLDRNGHGSGFWDERLGAVGDRLSDASKAFGEVYMYLGDNGKIYVA